jgi:hypothetical protein
MSFEQNSSQSLLPSQEKQVLINLHTESFKKTLDTYYQNQVSLDKIIITILFAELGFLIHSITIFNLWYFLPMVCGALGISFAMLSYTVNAKIIETDKVKITLDIFYTLGLEYKDETSTINQKFKMYREKLDKYNFIVYTMLVLTTVFCTISFYFMKQNPPIKVNPYVYFFAFIGCVVLLSLYYFFTTCCQFIFEWRPKCKIIKNQ